MSDNQKPLPVIRLEITQMREAIQHAMMTHNDGINIMIGLAVDKALNADDFQERIDDAVAESIYSAIIEVGSSEKLSDILRDMLLDSFKQYKKKRK